MKELIKKFLLKAGLRKEDDPSGAVRTEANAEAQGENKGESDEREKTSPKEPPVVKPLSQGKSWWRIDFNPNRSLEKASCHFLMTAIRKTALYILDP